MYGWPGNRCVLVLRLALWLKVAWWAAAAKAGPNDDWAEAALYGPPKCCTAEVEVMNWLLACTVEIMSSEDPEVRDAMAESMN